ncbi:PARS2 [Bugula neritina]|uniref:PARS2 n=1 Tax=Bugula neritina TaxID=10212 RepID=A0A7J7JWM4_BUGNE|nr:PARS2 [Bugula neritina]
MNRSRRCISKIFPNAVPSKDSAGAGLNQTETATASVSQILFSKKRLLERCYPGSYIINSYLLRALRKLEGLVDFHMQSIGAQRILMPSLSPSHLWKDSGRWDLMGKELFRVEDRNDNQLCLAPTHEETVCSIGSQSSAFLQVITITLISSKYYVILLHLRTYQIVNIKVSAFFHLAILLVYLD